MEDADARARAEQLNLQAEFRYIKIQSHIKVYGRRNAEMEQEARNGIEFIEAALKLVPNSAKYLNTYALLLADGLEQKKLAQEILERAAQLAPDDIQLQQNIRGLKAPSQGCLVLCFGAILALTVGYVFTRACYS
jgi:tetratricopeptide (TPR) repeat protein